MRGGERGGEREGEKGRDEVKREGGEGGNPYIVNHSANLPTFPVGVGIGSGYCNQFLTIILQKLVFG